MNKHIPSIEEMQKKDLDRIRRHWIFEDLSNEEIILKLYEMCSPSYIESIKQDAYNMGWNDGYDCAR